MLEGLRDYNPVSIMGGGSAEERQAAVQAFQNDDSVRVIVCSLKAGGVGITLTAASNVAFLELDWTFAGMLQAADRCHRIGQRDAVTAWQLIAPGTIDDDILAILETKRAIGDQVLDGKAPAEAETSVVEDVVTRMLSR
jgi:SWI/SNF-related matrix-associated actin-dependent regulator 1 of chromatin subfamily A